MIMILTLAAYLSWSVDILSLIFLAGYIFACCMKLAPISPLLVQSLLVVSLNELASTVEGSFWK